MAPDPLRQLHTAVTIDQVWPRHDLHNRAEPFGDKNLFDNIYSQFDPKILPETIQAHLSERKRFLESLSRCLPQKTNHPCRALEVGCGTGIDSYILAQRMGCSGYGIDLSDEALNFAKKAGQSFSVSLYLGIADILKLPFRDNSFDLVFSQGVLEHFSDDRAATAEQLRVLKPGGSLVINVPQRYTVYTIAKHYRIRSGDWPWGYETEYSCRRLRKLGRHFGLREIEVLGYGYWFSRLEPVWVLRSFCSKFQKINPLRGHRLSQRVFRLYDRFWNLLEENLGHHFLRNVVIVFRNLQ